MLSIDYELGDYLNLTLKCFYTYEPEVPEGALEPREEASVELDRVLLGEGILEYNQHLTPQQWREIEQWILEQVEQD